MIKYKKLIINVLNNNNNKLVKRNPKPFRMQPNTGMDKTHGVPTIS